jgi:hypothetical protein
MNFLCSSLNAQAGGRKPLQLLIGILLTLSVISLAACSYSAPNAPAATGTQTVNGTVSTVALTSVLSGSGGTQTATAVSLAVPLGSNSLVLCGDQRASFTLNASVQVSYNDGIYCSNLVSVTPH